MVFHPVQILANVPSGTYCPGTEQGTREWHGCSRLEAERVTRAVSAMSRSSRGGRAPPERVCDASRTAQRSHRASARPSLACLRPPAPAGLAQGSSAPLRPPRSPRTVPPRRQTWPGQPCLCARRGCFTSPSCTAAPR